MSRQGNYAEAVKEADAKVRTENGLNPHVAKWMLFRRWLGVYTREEKEVMSYSRRLKQATIAVATRQKVITIRPEWMRHEDYRRLRSFQNKVERKNPHRK